MKPNTRTDLPRFDRNNPDESLFNIVYGVIKTQFPYLNDTDFDEALSIGFLRILEIKDRFDITKKTKLETFLWTCVKNQISWYIFRKKKPEYIDPDILSTFKHEKKETDIEQLSRWKELSKILYNYLTPKQRRVFDLRMQGLKQREIAKIVGCTKSNIGYMLNRISEKGKLIHSNLEFANA